MIIQEVCPKCGHDLLHIMIATYPEIPSWVCQHCGWSYEGKREEVVRVPFQEKMDAEPKTVLCGYCKHWNAETKGCNQNPSVGAWEETDYCSYWESTEVEE